MASINSWISALRPRTLFLAVATTICGSGIANTTGHFSTSIFVLTIITATLLQLLSNMANDLGDFQHGTDTTGERVGPIRTMQSGAITLKEMKAGISIAIICSLVTGALLLWEASRFINWGYIILFIVLGIASIVAAIKYTAGKNPYGYKGLGDIFSFVFFGLVSVVGTYILHVHTLTFKPWLPAIGMGLFTAAVLNVNNMRDMENDKKSGKMTLAIRFGKLGSRVYHTLLLGIGIICFLLYGIIYNDAWYQYSYILFLIPFIIIQQKINKTTEDYKLDPYLKYTSMSTFFLALAFSICINLH